MILRDYLAEIGAQSWDEMTPGQRLRAAKLAVGDDIADALEEKHNELVADDGTDAAYTGQIVLAAYLKYGRPIVEQELAEMGDWSEEWSADYRARVRDYNGQMREVV